MRPLKLVPDKTNIPFLRPRKIALAISLLLIAASIFLLATRGLNWGIDFVGGQTMRVSFDKKVDIAKLRGEIEALDVGDVVLQEMGTANVVNIRIPLPGASNPIGKCIGAGGGVTTGIAGDANRIVAKVRASIVKNYPKANIGSVNAVSGKVGCELFSTGTIALALAMLGVALYIWFRFEWQFGAGGLITLVHDVIITFGFFSLTQLTFDLNVIAAFLTIIGYSLNDTVVIYDRIRENMRKYRKMDIESLLDLSINETLSRTVTTSISLVMTLAILLLIGPDTILGFVAAMVFGFIIGTYSSMYISAPFLIWLNVGPDSFLPGTTGIDGAERVRREEGVV